MIIQLSASRDKIFLFLMFLYLLSPEYIVGILYIQDYVAIFSFCLWLILAGWKQKIPSVFIVLLALPIVHLCFYGFLFPDYVFNEIKSFVREFLIIVLAISFRVSCLKRRHSVFLGGVVFLFIFVDLLQANRLIGFSNFSMQQYYDSIEIVLNLPRYVYYRDHISFTPLIVFLVTLAAQPFFNRWAILNYFSVLFSFLSQSRTYVFYLLIRFVSVVSRKGKLVFYITLLSLALCLFLMINISIEGAGFLSRAVSVFSADGREKLLADIYMRISNWLSWLMVLINDSHWFGIGSYGISNKQNYVFLEQVYAIDNIFVREFVRYGIFGIIKILVVASIFIKTFDRSLDPALRNYAVFIRYVILCCLVNDLLSNVIVRLCFYASVYTVYSNCLKKSVSFFALSEKSKI